MLKNMINNFLSDSYIIAYSLNAGLLQIQYFFDKIIVMSIKRTEFQESKDAMCKSCMLFYGAQAYQGLCSSCHKKNQNQKKEEIVPKVSQTQKTSTLPCRKDTTDTIEQPVQQPAQKDRKRCQDCNKKVGLLGIQCRCGFVFCNSHRMPQDHKCLFNHAEQGKKKLEKQIIKRFQIVHDFKLNGRTGKCQITQMNMITTKLNEFFGQISYRHYQFENTTQAKKNEEDRKQKIIRKAFRIFKKKKLAQMSTQLTEKQKQKIVIKVWEHFSEEDKMKYIELPKLSQKKGKKRKQDEAFKPDADQ